MKTDTKFPLWLWLIGWVVVAFAMYSTETLVSFWDWLFVTLLSFGLWPVILGNFIGNVWSFIT